VPQSQIQVSPPFTLTTHDWVSLAWGLLFAVLSAVGVYTTATVIPILQSHTANDFGVLLVTLLSAGLPVVASALKRFLTTTTSVTSPMTLTPNSSINVVVKLMLLAVLIGALTPCGLLAAEFMGASTGPTGSVITDLFSNLTKDPLLMAVVLIGGCLLASKVLKIDVTPFVLPLIMSLLKPPGPTPTPVPGPTPGPSPIPLPIPGPTPTDPTMALLLQLLQLLTKSRAAGDKESEAATLTLITGLLSKK
jgi:hypothetical protein